jgi:pimeloyl-[acyl-carrier protein] methyl ester esterase
MIAVVLLPGMDGTGDLFAEFARYLQEEVTPIIVKYPENRPLGYDELETHVRRFLPTDGPFVLLGESFSGPIAISISSSPPPGLIGLVLCCTFASTPHPWLRPLSGLINAMPISSKLTRLIAPLLFGRFSSNALLQSLQRALSKVPASTLRSRMRAVLDIDVSEKLNKIQTPILYLQAANDRIIPESSLSRIRKHAMDLMVVSLQAPHLLLQVIPSEAATIIKKFTLDAVVTFNTAVNAETQHAAPLLP